MGNTYFVRAFATNVVGTVYGTQSTLDFRPVQPDIRVSTENRNISEGTITFRGDIHNVGDPAFTEWGFVYGTSPNPTIENGTRIDVSGTSGTIRANVTGLTRGTLYYVRAFAINANDGLKHPINCCQRNFSKAMQQ